MAGGFHGGAVGGFHGGLAQGFHDHDGGFRGRDHDGGFRDHDRGFRHAFGGFYPYSYDDDYPYYDSYYDNGSCYVVQRRVHTTHGWRHQPVQVCG
jgi:hypothetical protein